MRAHWRHLANTVKLMLPLVYPSPQPNRHIDRFSLFEQLMVECRQAYPGVSFPLTILPSHGGSGPHLVRASPGPTLVHNPYGVWIGSAVFAQITAEYHYSLHWAAPFSPQNYSFPWGI